jgi:hypothetical protein
MFGFERDQCVGLLCAVLTATLGCTASDPAVNGASGGQAGSSFVAGGTTVGGSGGTVATGGSGGEAPSGGAAGTGAAAGGGAGGMTQELPNPTLLGDVQFSTPSQTFRDSLEVGMSTTVGGAEIRYTTDGQLPTATSSLYSGSPLALTATTELRAQAFVAGSPTGQPSTGLYIARTFDASSDLPMLIVDGYGGGKPEDKEVYLRAAFMLFEPSGGMASLSNLPMVATRAGYHVRGQSSAGFPQSPYRLELWDNADQDADYALLGLPADSDWALIPPYYDRSLLRNPFVYDLGRELGLEAPRWRFVEVYLNYEQRALTEDDYQGIYWFSETIKNAKVRTNLQQLREDDTTLPDISGGYIFKFDQAAAEEPILECTGSDPISGGFGGPTGGDGTCWVDLEVVDPELPNAEQESWLTSYIQTFHDSLHQAPIGDYSAYIDVPSFVDYLIINELTRNVDAYVRSAFYFKDRDGKIKAGPLWDYNFSLAVGGSGTIDPAGGFQFEGTRNVNNWYPKLVTDPAFMAQVSERWLTLRQGLLSETALDDRITALAAPLANAIVRDYAKWPVEDVLQPGAFVQGPEEPTWEGQLEALRTFIRARVTWMDSQLQ